MVKYSGRITLAICVAHIGDSENVILNVLSAASRECMKKWMVNGYVGVVGVTVRDCHSE